MENQASTLIIGIGNILWADEGFGVRAVEALHRHYQFPENVKLMDGGTQGIYLVQHIEAAEILVILDAIDYGLEPGSVKVIEGDAVPKYLGAKKVSLHQTGFQEVLAMAEMLGRYPKHILLVGVQPEDIEDFGGSLRDNTKACIEPVLQAALDWLGNLGIHAIPRTEPLPESLSLAGGEVGISQYESSRPEASEACRVGDERVLTQEGRTVAYRPQAVGQDAVSVEVDHRGKY